MEVLSQAKAMGGFYLFFESRRLSAINLAEPAKNRGVNIVGDSVHGAITKNEQTRRGVDRTEVLAAVILVTFFGVDLLRQLDSNTV